MPTPSSSSPEGGADLPPAAPAGKHVVLHTRVVTGAGGGPDKTILNSAPFLQGSAYHAISAYMHPPGDPGFEVIRQRAAEIDSPLIGVHDRGPVDWRIAREMLRLCKHYNVAIWHGHDYKSNLIGLMLRPFWKMKLVTTVHGWVKHTARTPVYYAVDRWTLPYYHHVVCVSDDLLSRMNKLRVKPSRTTLIRNAIDEQRFRRSGPPGWAPMRQTLGVPADRLVVGAVGRLSPEKGFDLLIRASKTLLDDGLDHELWIVGEGDQYAPLQRLITELGVDARVRLLGFQADTVAVYESLDGFVLSSLREGLPNVVLEALAMGVPTAATRVAGVPKMLTDQVDALLCNPGDTAQLTSALRTLLTRPDLRQSLASAGRRLIEQNYTFTHRMEKMREVYDRVLAE